VSVLPDTTLFMPADIGVKPARTDTTGVKAPAVGLPQSNLPPPGVYGPPVPGGPGSVPEKPARKGVFGLHPVVILLGLVVAHVAIIKLVTH